MSSLHWRLIPFFAFVLLIVLFCRGLELDPRHLPSTQVGKAVPKFTITSLDGKAFSSSTLKGQVSLLNVWASWCMACADEQTVLMQIAGQGISIYGLNYKDTTENAKQWLSEWGNPYKQVGEDSKGNVAINLGVYGAPETFLLDKNGIIRYRHVGAITMPIWKKEFEPRIHALESAV